MVDCKYCGAYSVCINTRSLYIQLYLHLQTTVEEIKVPSSIPVKVLQKFHLKFHH